MKRTISILCILFFCLPFMENADFGLLSLKAQNIKVTDFQYVQNDLTAMQKGTLVLDPNGEKCALIKVQTKEKGFSFDVGSLGVMKVEQKPGEIWVYVPYGIKRMTISHPQAGVLRNYPIMESIQKGRTYIMKLDVEIEKVDVIEDKLAALEKKLAEMEKGKADASNESTKSGKASKDKKEKEEKPARENNPVETKVFKVGNVEFKMIAVEGGTFKMGATSEQGAGENAERPVHQVTLSNYLIGETEVTQALWKAVMGSNPSYDRQDNYPVEQVSWEDCQEFISRLNEETGQTFRLPTEAEWEYAARGGKYSKKYKYSGSNKVGDVAWYTINSDEREHAVKGLLPNELGIYDMSGNVWEWCNDWFAYYEKNPETDPQGPESGDFKVIRCGCWTSKTDGCRISFRYRASPSDCCNYLGLRLAM